MQNLSVYGEPTQSAFVTTWTVVDTSSDDNDEVVCTKAAEAGRAHFITFLSVSTDASLRRQGKGVNAELKSASTTKYLIWPRAIFQAGSVADLSPDGTLPLSVPIATTIIMDEDSGPWFIEFEAPLQMGVNEAATFSSAMDGDDDQVTFTMGGFTSDVRVD